MVYVIRAVHLTLEVKEKSAFAEAIEKNYKQLKAKIKEVLKKQVRETGVRITSDLSSFRVAKGYMAVLVHFITEEFELKKLFLVIKEFGLEKSITSFTTDNGSDMVKAAELLFKYLYPEEVTESDNAPVFHPGPNYRHFHFSCLAHINNLITKEVLSHVKVYSNRARRFRLFFKSTSRFTEWQKCVDNAGYHKEQEKQLPSIDVSTHWDSLYVLVHGLCKRKDIILEVSKEMRANDDTSEFRRVALTERDFKILKLIADILEPSYKLTKMSSRDLVVNIQWRERMFEDLKRALRLIKVTCQVVDEETEQGIEMDFGKEYLHAVQSIGRGVASALRKKVGNYDELVTSSNQLELAKILSKQLYSSREVSTGSDEWKRQKELLLSALKKIREPVTDVAVFVLSLSLTKFTDDYFYPEEDSEAEGEDLTEDKNEKEVGIFLKKRKIKNNEHPLVF
eukprot:snap_masked-scaffold_1-processed-gene-14.12-mRNA-1 protein AED:1.00 eAED:1.00 QI:0/0/0/0/1/1/2/0/451